MIKMIKMILKRVESGIFLFMHNRSQKKKIKLWRQAMADLRGDNKRRWGAKKLVQLIFPLVTWVSRCKNKF